MACKNLTNINNKISKLKIVDLLAELLKRVPPNQIEKFLNFRAMSHSYQARVDKFPEKLPKIDWDYYRANVRQEYCKMVDDFEKKYEELNKIFDNRAQVDTTKYFKEVDKVKSDVKVEVEKFIKESNERIKVYEAEIERVRNMIPYEQMTCEEFCVLLPHNAHILGAGENQGFWPHTPEEQLGYVNPELEKSKEDKEMLEDMAEAQQGHEALQQPAGKPTTGEAQQQPAPVPSKEDGSSAAATKPKTAEVSQPSPAQEKPAASKAIVPKPKTAEVSQPSPAQETPAASKAKVPKPKTEVSQPSPAQKKPDPSAATVPKPKTAEVPQPSPEEKKTDPSTAIVPKPKTTEVPQPSPVEKKPGTDTKPSQKPRAELPQAKPSTAPKETEKEPSTKDKPSTASKETEKEPSTKKKESDKKDDPKNDGENK